MNNTRTEVIGIDFEIQDLQTVLYDSLISLWVDNIDGYGRAYKNTKNDKVLYEYYLGKDEYLSIYHDDQKAATMFFADNEIHTTEDGIVYLAEVKCIFMVDLGRIFPNDVERSDSKAHKHVTQIIHENYQGEFTIKSIDKGLDAVFRGVDTESIKFSDINPYHVFSVVIDLSYYLNNC